MGLFFALQRHEEQASPQPIAELLVELLESAVPEDTLARRAARDAVTVTTPQGALGQSFDVVVVTGVQDGVWPNLRARGSFLGTVAFERWLRGDGASEPSRKDTMHDELRLFAQACSRAAQQLLVVAVSNDEQHPSPFFAFGRDLLREGLPSSRLTLRGMTAQLRRRVIADPADQIAVRGLHALAAQGVAGAHPDEWYGVLPPSVEQPLFGDDPSQRIPVSPSQLERAEECPLDWAINTLGGGEANVAMALGTLVHHAFETVAEHDADALFEAVLQAWSRLSFESDWDAARTRDTAQRMVAGLAEYLREFDASGRILIGRETGFSVPLGRAELRGKVDRVEGRRSALGLELSVVDLKTGANPPSGPETQRHAQLQAYQLAIAEGAFDEVVDADAVELGGARLLFVHPQAAKNAPYVERAQAPLDAEATAAFAQRVAEVVEVMAQSRFTARVEHHCSDSHKSGSCRIHIVPAVSHA